MNKIVISLLSLLLLIAGAFLPKASQAEIESKVFRSLDLKTSPIDIAPSLDGQRLFVLTPGELLIYSIVRGTITDRIPVDKEFDRIVSLPRGDALSISSSKKKVVQIVLLENIYKIDVGGLPFKGPQNAPVTIVVYDDYQ